MYGIENIKQGPTKSRYSPQGGYSSFLRLEEGGVFLSELRLEVPIWIAAGTL